MPQNNDISLSLGDRIDILNKTQSLDARYGVYDTRAEALLVMQSYGADGRQVAVYTDKPNGKVELLLYNETLDQLEEISTSIGYTPEDVANKVVDLSNPNNTEYPTTKAVVDFVGEGDLEIQLNGSSVDKFNANQSADKVIDIVVTKADVGLGSVPNTDFTSAVLANTDKVTNATHTGEVTGSGALTITPKAVTNAKLADVPTNTVKGRVAAGSGVPKDLTPAEVRTMLNVENADLVKETIVTTGGAINNQPTPTTFLNFTNQTTPVIIAGLGDPIDGKEETIWNNTLQAIDLLNESPSAIAANRMINLGLQDLLLPIDGKAVYRHSASLSRWTMVGIFGAGYQPTLKGVGTRAMTVLPSGVVASEEVAEFKVWNEAITTDQSNSQLNILYPDAFQGFTVVCKNNGREYEMDDENAKTWIWAPLNIV